MGFFDKMGKTFSDTVKTVTEKNHNMAQINRLRNRISLAQEEKEKAYIAIGKYYYTNTKELPDENIADSFVKIDIADREIASAVKEIAEINSAQKQEKNEEKFVYEEKKETSANSKEYDPDSDKNIPW